MSIKTILILSTTYFSNVHILPLHINFVYYVRYRNVSLDDVVISRDTPSLIPRPPFLLVSCPDPPRKAERGSGVLNDFSCHVAGLNGVKNM